MSRRGEGKGERGREACLLLRSGRGEVSAAEREACVVGGCILGMRCVSPTSHASSGSRVALVTRCDEAQMLDEGDPFTAGHETPMLQLVVRVVIQLRVLFVDRFESDNVA